MGKSNGLRLVVVNYFAAEQVVTVVERLSAFVAGLGGQIFCVDNSCDPHQANILNSIPSNIFNCIFSEENMGYGAAINCAVGGSGDDILILNPDVDISVESIQILWRRRLDHPEEGIYGGLSVGSDGLPDKRHAWREPSVKRALGWAFGVHKFSDSILWNEHYSALPQEIEPVDAISGCCMLITADAWQSVSGFDEDFFLYSEEIDLCYRARQQGYTPVTVAAASLGHPAHGETVAFTRLHWLFSGKVLFAKKHFSMMNTVLYRYSLAFGVLLRGLNMFLSRRSGKNVWATLFVALVFDRIGY